MEDLHTLTIYRRPHFDRWEGLDTVVGVLHDAMEDLRYHGLAQDIQEAHELTGRSSAIVGHAQVLDSCLCEAVDILNNLCTDPERRWVLSTLGYSLQVLDPALNEPDVGG